MLNLPTFSPELILTKLQSCNFISFRARNMENTNNNSLISKFCGSTVALMRKFLFGVLSSGPIPEHIAFILDGNRRYARKWKLGEGMGHRAGFLSLMALMKYCYELGIKYVTIYAFSIDNFRRKPHEVKYVMDLMYEKIQGMLKEESIVNHYGVRVYFIGNLKLLDDNVRIAAEMAMKATAKNKKAILLICVAYTSTDEIAHAAQESCEELWEEMQSKKANKGAQISEISDEKQGKVISNEKHEEKSNGKLYEAISKREEGEMSREKGKYDEEMSKEKEEFGRRSIKGSDIEKHMYMGVAPDVDILLRSSGETRLSNFLSWQTWNGLLYSPNALWPEIGLPHLVWAILIFQKAYPFFEKRKKQL